MTPRVRGPEALVLIALRLVMGALLLFSAYQKLKPPTPATADAAPLLAGYVNFEQQLRAYEIVPEPLVKFVTFAVPWTEAVVGASLVTGLLVRSAATLAVGLLVSFTAGVASVILRGKSFECGCFGKFRLFCEGGISWCKVGENLVLIAACIPVAFRGVGWRLGAPSPAELEPRAGDA